MERRPAPLELRLFLFTKETTQSLDVQEFVAQTSEEPAESSSSAEHGRETADTD